MSYELFIGLRYTRSRQRTRVISFISAVSVVCIALGMTALITVLSVMNGFQREIRTPHPRGRLARADQRRGRQARRLAARRGRGGRAHPQVVAAAPYVVGQGLLTNGSAVRGAFIRGIAARAGGARRRYRQAHEAAAASTRSSPASSASCSGASWRGALGAAAGRQDRAGRAAGTGDAGRASCRGCGSSPSSASSRSITTSSTRGSRWCTSRMRRGCSGSATRVTGVRLQLEGPVRGAAASRASWCASLGPDVYATRLDAAERDVLPRGGDREAHDVPDRAPHHRGGRVQHRLQPDDGGEGQERGHRDPAHARREPGRHHQDLPDPGHHDRRCSARCSGWRRHLARAQRRDGRAVHRERARLQVPARRTSTRSPTCLRSCACPTS